MSGRDLVVPLYAITDVREITRSALIPARSEMIDSVIPSAKYSWDESFDRFLSGSTAIARIVSREGIGSAPLGTPSLIPRRVCATTAADSGRCAGCLRRHSAISLSRASGVSARSDFADGAVL